jgi:hypothetical protein
VVYGDAKGNLEVIAQAARAMLLLEMVARRESDQFAWPEPFTLERWDLSTLMKVAVGRCPAGGAAYVRVLGREVPPAVSTHKEPALDLKMHLPSRR